MLFLCVALRKALEGGGEAKGGRRRECSHLKEHGGLARDFLSVYQVKSTQEPLIACCSMVLLSEYIFHGPPASVTN